MSSAIEIDHLTVRRGGHAVLSELSTTVATGTVTGLLGPSGCGKTTLIRAVVGVQRIAGGTVTVLGEPAGSPQLRDRVGYVTQSPSVYGDLSVRENLRYFASMLGAADASVPEVLAAVRLDDKADALVGQLSGGQRARVSLAAALLGHPTLLVLDEPTVGLDPVLRQELWQLFHSMADEGATLLVSSHVMDEAARCDQLLLMREGQLLADDTPGAIRTRTGQDDLERAFLALVQQSTDEIGVPA